MIDWLLAYKWWIWVGGGITLLWLFYAMPQWHRMARGGQFTAQRDYARWRFRNGILALALLLPLVLGTVVLNLLAVV